MSALNRKQFNFALGSIGAGYSIVVGAAAFMQSVILKNQGEYLAASVFILAAALSFGSLANAVLRALGEANMGEFDE